MQRLKATHENIPNVRTGGGVESKCVCRWKMDKISRMRRLEELHISEMDKQKKMVEENGNLPDYYYNENKVDPNMYVYTANPKQRKGEDEREGKHTRAVKKGQFK